MCLKTVKFALDENGVGVGYKNISASFFDITIGKAISKNKKWSQKAFVTCGVKKTHKFDNYTRGDKKYWVSYIPGFHIFLDAKDARAYDTNAESIVVKVEYKEVLAFGTNEVEDETTKPCVIARQMKIIGRV